MELPHLGQNCALKQCNRLDFLPVKCDTCLQVFCIEHYKYDDHNCEKARNKDVQVPVCPLCSAPVPGKSNQLPDVAVSEHMDKYCRGNEALKNKLVKPKTNLQACCFKSCKQKDLIYLECNDCKQKFCIRHRHPSDHSCTGPKIASIPNWQSFKGSCSSSASSSYEMIRNKARQVSRSGHAALARLSNTSEESRSSNRNLGLEASRIQGSLSEQEALAIALRESQLNGAPATNVIQQLDDDLALARAIHESELEARRRSQPTSNKDKCILS